MKLWRKLKPDEWERFKENVGWMGMAFVFTFMVLYYAFEIYNSHILKWP